MATEEKAVLTELAPENEGVAENATKEEVVAPLAVASAEGTVAESESGGKEDKEANEEVKPEEGEEGFETPEEGEGDGGTDEAKLDDDQDIESPAYIPKTGKYYMHDSREDTEAPREEKKSRADGMWSRDRYDERYQQPRSRKQMIEKYGFDIRLGETKEIAEVKEKEMRDAGEDLESEFTEKDERREMNRKRDGTADRNRGQRRGPQQLRDEQHAKGTNGENNDDDDVRPAARRDARREYGKGSFGGAERGEERVNRGGYGGRGEGAISRGDRGRGGPPRQFNRTFNNSSRNNGRDEIGDRGAPKRYSTQRGEKIATPAAIGEHPTDIVYFDPTKQTSRENPALIREKKPLDIVPPPS